MKFLPILLLSVLLVLPAQAARRIGKAEVRAGANGAPCFTISEHEEKRGGTPDFQSITVSDPNGKPVWTMAMPRERTFSVAFSMCIPYAGRVQALPQTPALALETGKRYQVLIEARKAKNAASPLRYLARFCLMSGAAASSTAIRSDCPSPR